MRRLLLPVLLACGFISSACQNVDEGPQPIVDAIPKITSASAQSYKAALQARNLHGYAFVKLQIAADGSVLHVTPVGGSPDVLAVIMPLAPGWKYHPAMKDGQPVPYTLIVRASLDQPGAPSGPYAGWLERLRSDPWAGPYLAIHCDLPPQPLKRGDLPRMRGLDGHVLLAFVVETDGAVRQARVLEDTGGAAEAQVALHYVMTSTYRAAEKAGQKVPQLLLVPMDFSSEGFRKY